MLLCYFPLPLVHCAIKKFLLFFFLFSQYRKGNIAVTFHGACLPSCSGATVQWLLESLSGIQFICILMPLRGSVCLCQSKLRVLCTHGSSRMYKLTISILANHLAGNFHLSAEKCYSPNSFCRTIYCHQSPA